MPHSRLPASNLAHGQVEKVVRVDALRLVVVHLPTVRRLRVVGGKQKLGDFIWRLDDAVAYVVCGVVFPQIDKCHFVFLRFIVCSVLKRRVRRRAASGTSAAIFGHKEPRPTNRRAGYFCVIMTIFATSGGTIARHGCGFLPMARL